jgi:hypothetical protein
MASATKYFLQEQMRYRLDAGNPTVSSVVQQEDIIAAISDWINAKLKLQHISEVLPSGDTIPQNLMIATYNDIAIVTYGDRKCKAVLPVQPTALIRNMGVFMVDSHDDFSCPFIPLQAGQAALLKGQPMINDLLGQVGYEIFGKDVIITQDLTINNITTVHFRLLVMDITEYDDYTPLPIPSDWNGQLIKDVYESFIPVEQTKMATEQITNNPRQVQK